MRIRVERQDEFAPRKHQSVIEIRGLSGMIGIGEDAYASGSFKSPSQRYAIIAGMVVRKDDFDVAVVTVQDRLDRLHNASARVPAGDDDGYEWGRTGVLSQGWRREGFTIQNVGDSGDVFGNGKAHESVEKAPKEQ